MFLSTSRNKYACNILKGREMVLCYNHDFLVLVRARESKANVPHTVLSTHKFTLTCECIASQVESCSSAISKRASARVFVTSVYCERHSTNHLWHCPLPLCDRQCLLNCKKLKIEQFLFEYSLSSLDLSL